MGGDDVGTPKIPSFEEALGSLKVESPLGAVVTSSPHRRLAELRLAETIAWLFLVLNTKGPSPYGGGSAELPWFNRGGLARLSGAYVAGITGITPGFPPSRQKGAAGPSTFPKPRLGSTPIFGPRLWGICSNGEVDPSWREHGGSSAASQDLLRAEATKPRGERRWALGNRGFLSWRYPPRPRCFMKPVAGPFGCGLSSFTPSSPRHPGMRSKPFTEVLRWGKVLVRI